MTSSADQPEQIDIDLQILGSIVAALAKENGAEQRACAGLASLAERWQSPRLPAIVVGEVSSGKTTLINALLGARVLPTDFRVATSAWTQLSHGPRLTAMAFLQGGTEASSPDEITAIDLDPAADLPDYLTVQGYERLAARHGDQARVVSVDVTVPAEILESGLELLDTPGVGGLRAAHRRATLNALAEADAVIFVTKPGEPLSKSEMLTLADAVDRVQACVIVHTHRDERADADQALADDLITLTDASRWMAVLDDQERAEALAARFAAVPGASVSASNALKAAERPEGTVRQHLIDASNLPMLREILDTQVVACGRAIHRGNIIRLMEVLLQSVRTRTQERIMILEGSAAAAEAIEKLEELVEKWVRQNGDYWRRDFEDTCNKLPGRINEFAQGRARELVHAYQGKFVGMPDEKLREAVEYLVAQPERAFAEMLKIAADGIEEASARVTKLLEGEGLGLAREQMQQATTVFSRLPGQPDGLPDDASRAPRNPDDVRSALLGGLAGAGAAGVAAAVLQGAGLLAAGMAVPLLLPVALGAILFVGINRHNRSRARTVEAAQGILGEVCQEITTRATSTAKEAALKAKNKIAMEIGEALAEDEKRVRRARQDLAESANLTAEERQLRLDEAADVLSRAEELSDELEKLHDRVKDAGQEAEAGQ
jgi:predicted GTPase